MNKQKDLIRKTIEAEIANNKLSGIARSFNDGHSDAVIDRVWRSVTIFSQNNPNREIPVLSIIGIVNDEINSFELYRGNLDEIAEHLELEDQILSFATKAELLTFLKENPDFVGYSDKFNTYVFYSMSKKDEKFVGKRTEYYGWEVVNGN